MPELKDKLDTSVNGPEDPRPVFPAFDGDAWERVDWRRCEEEVRRLRSRIFKAVQERGHGHGCGPAEADAAQLA